MPVISVRVSSSEKKFLSAMAKFYGLPVSELLKDKSLVQLEDKYDALVGEDNYLKYIKHGKQSYSLQQVEQQLKGRK